MAPQPTSTTTSNTAKKVEGRETTMVISPADEPSYVVCTSKDAFSNPLGSSLTPKQVNQGLNLNLGLPIVPENLLLRKVIRLSNVILLMWWEDRLFDLIKLLPLAMKRGLNLGLWKIYFRLHKYLLGRSTGIHPAASEGYHALTSILYWGRLFPVSISRMRFSLSQLGTCTDNVISSSIETIRYEMPNLPPETEYSSTVQGLYVHSGRPPTNEKCIFWLYGGAYLSGDTNGNKSVAEKVGKACGVNVFLAQYSLIPEAKYDECVWDVCLAYHWLVTVRGLDPSNIILYGISSGSGLATRLLQFIGMHQRGEPVDPPYFGKIISPMPSGAVLLCPFVDYTEAGPDGSFLNYAKHDLIVNQSVLESGVPYFEPALGNRRRSCSPCYGDCRDLPPLCVIVSEHETVYDQTLILVNRAREQGVDVTLGVWKYMCHVFCFLGAFCTEGKQAMDFSNNWIMEHIKN